MTTAMQPFTGTYELDPVHSSVQFAVTHLTVSTFRASFSDLEARLTIDEGTIALEARASVESLSIVEPLEFREHIVRGTDFFDANAHPTITFRSASVDLVEDGTATVSGQLTIRGIQRPVTAYGTYRPPTEDPFGRHRAGLELHGTIDRRGWEMDWQSPLPSGGDALAWDVEISAQLELIRTS